MFQVRLLKLASVLVVALLAGWAFTRGSLFRVSHIEVLSDDEALAKALNARFVGLYGQGLFAVSLTSLEQDVRAFPRIKAVSLRRRWPSTLLIRPELRNVVALEFQNGRLWTVDDEGSAVEALASPVSAPLLKGFGDDLSARRSACAWLASLSSYEGTHLEPSQIDEIEWKRDRGLVVHFSELALEVELGFEDYMNAFSRADLALGVLQSKKYQANFLDASSVRRVVARGAPSLQNSDSSLTFREKMRRDSRSRRDPAAVR